MNTSFARGMVRATELTRSGKLMEATALIHSLMRPSTDQGTETAVDSDPADGVVIEGTFVPLGDAVPTPKPKAPRKTARPAVKPGRTRLGKTLRLIAAGGMPGWDAVTQPSPDLPKGAQLLSLTHQGKQGSREYRLYIPASATKKPMPLVVMLHGCTQSPEDFATGTGMNALAEEFGCLIAWPAQPQGANAQKCWNWFRPEDQGRDRGEPALIAGIVRDILRDHPADPDRVYAAGLSAGGAAAAILGATYPDIFAAVGIHSGLPVGGAQDIPSAFAAMRGGSAGKGASLTVPAIVFHGLADSTVHPGNGTAIMAQALKGKGKLKPNTAAGAVDVAVGKHSFRQTRYENAAGRSMAEHWEIEGAGHAWAGGQAGGSYTDPKGPDASREMLRFFLQHRRA